MQLIRIAGSDYSRYEELLFAATSLKKRLSIFFWNIPVFSATFPPKSSN